LTNIPGAALPSIICALANASSVTATDHPSSPSFNGAMKFNIEKNLSSRTPPLDGLVSMQPHEWGSLNDEFSTQNKASFGRIIAADCFWMRQQHENLVRTMEWFLKPGGRVLVVACFHTGRTIVAGFFETVLENGFVIEDIYERDLLAKQDYEIRREWMPYREGEMDQSRWCVVAVLKRDGDA
jgi:nicotinamide N-methyltransferase